MTSAATMPRRSAAKRLEAGDDGGERRGAAVGREQAEELAVVA